VSFVSYAQNFEDVILWRALHHIKDGCYVDVGAQHPVIDSVSKAFYERGWRGIHFEPVPQYAALLREDRPEDIVIEAALSNVEGTLELNVFPETGLSTLVDAYAERHQHDQGLVRERIHVPVLTLKSGLDALAGRDVHWLKIDVEGHEENVLKGWDSMILRPWIMVVEATIPNSPEVEYRNWEQLLLEAGYVFVYFDGLNRFYIVQEKPELRAAFSSPPNVFDDIVLTEHSSMCRGILASNRAMTDALNAEKQGLHIKLNESLVSLNEALISRAALRDSTENELQHLRGKLASESEYVKRLQAELNISISKQQHLQGELDTLFAKQNHLQAESQHWWTLADKLTTELHAIQKSKSWQITLPLRLGMHALNRTMPRYGLGQLMGRSVKRVAKPIVGSAMRYVMANPRFRENTLQLLARYPTLKQRLKVLAVRAGVINAPSPYNGAIASPPLEVVDGKISLSPRAGLIYERMKQVLEKANN
jgi:FkbM family methyltransferase